MSLLKHTTKEHLAKVIFLILPTWLVCFFILWISSQYFAVIQQNQYQAQALYIGLGMLASSLFYAFRFRFVPTFAILLLGFYFMYYSIDKVSYGEFDAFFYSIQFLIFAILFSLGWLLAWGFLRQERFPIVASGIFFIVSIYLISKQIELSSQNLLSAFLPLLLYTLYIFYTVQVIAKHKDASQPYWWHLIRRLGLFVVLSFCLIGGVLIVMRAEIKAKLETIGGGGQKGKESMLKKDKDGNFSLSDYTKLRGNLGRTNELLFVAKIDNFFEDGTPNPLYLTGFYYSKYDPETETFKPDTLLPESDLFRPNPSKVGMYFTQTDSNVLKDALQHKFTKTVNVEVYKTILSPNEFTAPTTSFFLQPIAVDKNNKQQYKSAYRAKSLVSELNSAYFVYNPNGEPMLEAFQEMRFEKLRLANDYSSVSKTLMDYYTAMPTNGKFQEVAALAKKVTAGKNTNVDKVLAIRDYFLSKDENGKPLYKYSDNPGIPDIPSASKLNYFLFENRKGYCAYYAGATLFMLRSLGIPSRIVAGFLTQDRSAGNNKGWYWYYADQAHAWVQVYFPGYGWLDFDTTVGNEDAQNAPNPDGTPPNTPGNALLAVDGVITAVDTIHKLASIKALKMVFKDKNYDKVDVEMKIDLSVATIEKDSLTLPITQLKVGDSATAISFAEVYKNIAVSKETPFNVLLERFPKPAPIDELHIKVPKIKDQLAIADKRENEKTPIWKKAIWSLLAIAILAVLLFVSFAYIYKAYLKIRKRSAQTFVEKAFWDFRYSQFLLHQLGFEKGNQSALQFAQEVDTKMPLHYAKYMQHYLKLKYAEQALSNQEKQFVEQYIGGFERIIQIKLKFKNRFKKFANPMRTFGFIKQV